MKGALEEQKLREISLEYPEAGRGHNQSACRFLGSGVLCLLKMLKSRKKVSDIILVFV